MSAHIDPIPREARPFQGHRAGLVTRTLAAAIDVAIVTVALGVCYLGIWLFLLLYRPRNFSAPTLSPWLVSIAGCLLLTLYLAVNWMGGGGRTYGNHVMGLRVVNREGRRLGPFLALVRAAFCVIFPIGLLWVLFSRQNRSLQDLVLRTSVIYDWDVRPLQEPPKPIRQ
ncbi:MAG TPA: RDD family protein [Propionibacteriaceae bacterium]|nr:RDD family protein [Propionibacteriaceae bacterium]